MAGAALAPHWVNRWEISKYSMPQRWAMRINRSTREKSKRYASPSFSTPSSWTQGRSVPISVSSGGVKRGVSTMFMPSSPAAERNFSHRAQCSSDHTGTR